ncbi:MAG: hypothetical protein R3B91_04470 [Planctomycetaceae bacterium]
MDSLRSITIAWPHFVTPAVLVEMSKANDPAIFAEMFNVFLSVHNSSSLRYSA